MTSLLSQIGSGFFVLLVSAKPPLRHFVLNVAFLSFFTRFAFITIILHLLNVKEKKKDEILLLPETK